MEASDRCVTLVLLLQDNGSLDRSPFNSPKAIVNATIVERLAHGPVAKFDIRCRKSDLPHSFASFKYRIGLEQIEPTRQLPTYTPTHEQFMQTLQQIDN
jgi:hypothetical protein